MLKTLEKANIENRYKNPWRIPSRNNKPIAFYLSDWKDNKLEANDTRPKNSKRASPSARGALQLIGLKRNKSWRDDNIIRV